MGRAMSWLAKERPIMVKILREIERGSAYTGGELAHGDLSLLLARLSQVAAGIGGKARTVPAMRQAWWRWTTDGEDKSTPPVLELALVVRHAKNLGWLTGLSADCLPLVQRLQSELQNLHSSQRRVLERAWAPEARLAVERLSDFLNNRISKLEAGEGDDYWRSAQDATMAIQEEVRTMVCEVVERVVASLDAPREISATKEGEPLLQPHLGWPDFFRGLAQTTSQIFTDAARDYEQVESDAIERSVREQRANSRKAGGPRRGQIVKPRDDDWVPE